MTAETPRGDDREALSLLLRQAARAHLRLGDGDHWPSDVADAQARAVTAAGFTRAPQDAALYAERASHAVTREWLARAEGRVRALDPRFCDVNQSWKPCAHKDAAQDDRAAQVLREALESLESLDEMCRDEDVHGSNIRAHEVRGAVAVRRAAVAAATAETSRGDDRELSLLLRQAARAHLRLGDGDHWPSDVADAQASAAIRAGFTRAPQDDRAEVWEEGYDAGHQDARAVQATYPELTRNPYLAASPVAQGERRQG